MPSEYDPLRKTLDDSLAEDSLERVRELFEEASRPYVSRPWSWLGWAVILPMAALATPRALQVWGETGGLVLWSLAVLAGGLIEVWQIMVHQRHGLMSTSSLAAWVLRSQGNLSLVAVLLSIALVLRDEAWLLPGIWLLILGHSLYSLGGLAAGFLRTVGLIYQVGGALAMWPHGGGLALFAVATGVGNLWVALSIWRAASGNH